MFSSHIAKRIFRHSKRRILLAFSSTRRIFSVFILLFLLVAQLAPFSSAYAQSRNPVGDLMARMTAEEKVGQLFLVTFKGTDASPQSRIYDLITNHHIGGVVLTNANDNFVAAPATTSAAHALIGALQQAEWDGTTDPAQPSVKQAYVPLSIGISQEGGGFPNDQILSGLTSIPDEMAIGATWDRTFAEQAGQVVGRELSALGFNLYLGLSLDVLNLPNPAVNADLNTRVFGGDPYWVGELGRAFISGLHLGSNNRMAVIAKHFPGRGGSDRPADQEVSTIRRSLEELKQIELLPFFAVTGEATSPEMTVDGLLVSHIRYQGFQGNIRATTRPISMDQQALNQILVLPQLQAWRQSGGLMISDDLGVQAVRRFYDPDNRSFFARLVARDAFLAGNDLLYMGNIVSSDGQDSYTAVLRTLDFFAQKYREDPAFAGRVDESVWRILTAKFRLYPTFTISTILPAPLQADTLGQANDGVFAMASEAATLISPSQADLPSVLPSPPNTLDYIVFISDVRYSRQCSTCPDVPVLPVDAFQSAVLRLYGPSAGALVTSSHLSSYSFSDVDFLLQDRLPTPDMRNSLGRANIVIISALDLPDGQPQIQILRRFLSERQSLLASKRVIMFAFGAPYYLDATDISKLTAYYGIYSSSPPFVEVAARLLFQEITPGGSLPVSVPGIGYDLISATAPDPEQVISLSVDLPTGPTPEGAIIPTPNETDVTSTPETTPAPLFLRLGDTIAVRTGVIIDHNKRPVPDGTVVRFVLSQGESGLIQQVEAVTSSGVATANFPLNQAGLIEIHATSEPARVSNTIQLTVTSEGTTVIIITPTPVETTASPVPTPTPRIINDPEVISDGYPTFFGWLLVMLVMASGIALAYWLGIQFAEVRWAVRWSLLVMLGGLVVYNYLTLDMPGAGAWLDGRGFPAFLQAVILGQAIGFLGGWLWRSTAERGDQADQQQDSSQAQ
jgi:beta-N-acetylhexosaminidase